MTLHLGIDIGVQGAFDQSGALLGIHDMPALARPMPVFSRA
jgi:hypothetical protein